MKVAHRLTLCLWFATFTQIASLRSATSHTPETLGERVGLSKSKTLKAII